MGCDKYFQDFTQIANYLRQRSRIDQGALDRLYIQGFGNATRRRIEHKLSITQPDQHPDDPYPQPMVQEAAQFLLSSTSPLSTLHIDQKPNIPRLAPQPAVKTETAEMAGLMTVMQQMVGSLAVLTQQVTSMAGQRQGGSGGMGTGSNANNNSSSNNTNTFGNKCHFCGEVNGRVR